MNAASWFGYIQNNWFLGLRNLGFWNVINILLAVPMYLGIFWLHRKTSPAFASLGLGLVVIGAAVYVANNRALSLLALSSQYAAATEVQKTLLETAGTVILAQAEDFTPGTFMGFLLSSLASLIMMSVMLRGKVFRTWVAVIGLVGTGSLLIFTISATFIPAIYDLAMIFAMVGGLLMIAWNFVMAFRMLRMGTGASVQAEELPTHLGRTGGRILSE